MKPARRPIPIPALLAATWMAAGAVEIPPGPLARMGDEKFATRAGAELEVLAWARQRPEPAMEALFRESRSSDDPEIRERCLSVLRVLVADEYLREGEGYIGIQMRDEMAQVPGDARARGVVRVIQIMPGTAAETAGIEVNDLIVGLGQEAWHHANASEHFGRLIRQHKPNSEVVLNVLRNGKLIDVPVTLGRRPLYADNPFMAESEVDLEAAEKAAQEAYFRSWLERKKAAR